MNETKPPIMTINDELLAELEAAAKAATGSWYTVDSAYRFPMYSSDKSYVEKSSPSTILALLQHVRDLKADAERLDSLDKLCEAYGFEVYEGNRWVIDGPFRSIRDAIDSLPDDFTRSSAD